ncbi:MAG: hypothetical protein EHM72_12205 [Calditrichaeota bacterium]|nr:MAG: hypothetical protein EHM72_12205 [Calditrichota bacterium]
MKKMIVLWCVLMFFSSMAWGADQQKKEATMWDEQFPAMKEVKMFSDRPHIDLIALSFVSALMAYDSFKDYQSLDRQYERGAANTAEIIANRDRKFLIGVAWSAFTVSNTFYALKRVKVVTDGQSIGLQVDF